MSCDQASDLQTFLSYTIRTFEGEVEMPLGAFHGNAPLERKATMHFNKVLDL